MDRVGGAVSSRLGQVAWALAAALAAAFLIFEVGENLFKERIGQFFLMLLLLLGGFLVFVYLINRTREDRVDERRLETIGEPGVAHFLFHDTRSAPLWLVVRLYLGYAWLEAGYHKLTGTGWMNNGGAALRGYWTKAIAVDPKTGTGPISYEWYRAFLQFMLNHHWETWFAKVIVCGELLVGLGLILGVLTGWAAFFGLLMNMSFMLAGSASTNPVLFSLSILLILAWRVAGFLGGDRYVLPFLGVPGLGRPASRAFGGTLGHRPEATGAPAG